MENRKEKKERLVRKREKAIPMQDPEEVFELLAKVADGLDEKRNELIEADVGAGLTYQGSSVMIDHLISVLKNFRPALKYMGGRKGICDGRDEEVVLIMPFNLSTPACGPIACQMLLGNNIRVKPSPIAFKAYRVLESIWKRHFPDRVRFDYREAKGFMKWALEEPTVKVIGAYGTDRVAVQYKEAVQQAGKKYFFEGPGKNPAIVLEDADPKDAAYQLFMLRFGINSGQVCISPGRFYIQEDLFEQFTDALIEPTKGLVVGDPRNPNTNIGPLGSELAVSMIDEQLKDAVAKGGKIIYGGGINGTLIDPTIVVNVNHDMKGMHDESFGPICWLMPFRNVKEAITLAKDNRYGLAVTIFGEKDVSKVKDALQGEQHLHDVKDLVFGKFGVVSINPLKGGALAEEEMERMAFGTIGGYGYSGWVWKTENGKFKIQQGPKLYALETSVEA